MKKKVFVDTNFLCSLYNPQDLIHQKAEKIRLNTKGWDLVLSNFILLECYTILSQRVSKKFAVYFGEKLLKEDPYNIFWINRKLEQEIWDIFVSIKDKNFSYVDASILAILKKEKIKHLLSFDTSFIHFQEKFNFKLIGA